MENDTKLDINLNEWEFEFQQREFHPALMMDLWLKAIRDYMPEELKLPVKSPDYFFTSEYKGYIKSKDKKHILKELTEAIANREYLQYIFRRTLDSIEEFDKTADEINLRISEKKSKIELAKMWENLEEKYLRMIPWFYIPWYLAEENVISNRVKARINRYKSKIEKVVNIDTALGILFSPTKETVFQNEQKDFFDLVSVAKRDPSSLEKNKEFQEKSKRYLENYSWMKTFILLPIEQLSYEELVIRIKEAVSGKLLEEYRLQEKNKIRFRKILKKLLEIFEKNPGLLTTIEDARELSWILTVSVERSVFSTSKLHNFYKSIARTIGVSYDLWIHLTSDEIMDLLRNKTKISDIDIKKRASATAAIMNKGRINWLYDVEAKQFTGWVNSNVGDINTNISEFSGQSVSTGKVIGKAYIAVSSAEAQNIAQGEILITSMTSPDYMPAIRKAAAIVTNEGGLLSHAAIVSRELSKPCIVGTKIATKVLKDGDLVEVDADKGVVKIINKVK